MRVLLDTNIILDFAFERHPFYTNTIQVFSFIYQKQIEGYLSASTFSDLYYIIRKDKGRASALSLLNRIVTLCQVATVDSGTINMALTTNFADFEDAIQYSTAVLNHLDAIITRNPGDFPVTTPRILTPEQLIREVINSQ
ncbi:MAG: type II toxin-antitoxin system VapC family toxin [Nostoc sp. ChiSLP01]|nr:PIN domain-containing protein [Nostoc sp. CmiSLP01]MDZ8289512.1 PIN domain-containing protein [Nostoc sp. ChiSLP01]